MKVEFDVKWGKNTIEIPITERTIRKIDSNKLTDLYKAKVTIYNDIPSDGENARRFDRFVIEHCNISSRPTESSDGTISRVINSQTIITKDIERYVSPIDYRRLAEDERQNYYTVQINDFVVFGEVADVVTTGREFQELQEKYANNGFSVTAVSPSIYGMNVDNIMITHA